MFITGFCLSSSAWFSRNFTAVEAFAYLGLSLRWCQYPYIGHINYVILLLLLLLMCSPTHKSFFFRFCLYTLCDRVTFNIDLLTLELSVMPRDATFVVRAAASTRIYSSVNSSSNNYSSIFTPRVLVTFYIRLKISISDCIFAVNWSIVGIYGKLGLRDFIFNLPAWKYIWVLYTYACSRSWLFGP